MMKFKVGVTQQEGDAWSCSLYLVNYGWREVYTAVALHGPLRCLWHYRIQPGPVIHRDTLTMNHCPSPNKGPNPRTDTLMNMESQLVYFKSCSEQLCSSLQQLWWCWCHPGSSGAKAVNETAKSFMPCGQGLQGI